MSETAFTAVETAAHEGAFGDNDLPAPTEAQREAGNYRVGRVSIHGLRIAIEQPRGSTRSGRDADGTRWSCRLAAHYGYFIGTRGADGDAVDVFVGPNPDADTAFVINQNVGGRFDEHKVVLGAVDEEHARALYRASYARDWRGLASVVPATIPQLKHWLRHGNKRRAVTPDHLHQQGTPMNRVFWNRDAQPEGLSLDQVLYHVRIADGGDNLLLDSVSMADILDDSEGVIALDAMVLPVNLLARKMDVLKAIMERTGATVKPLGVQISDPFKVRGVTNVAALFELSDGQTVSIYFHNPDTTPNKLAPTDDLISWKWLLNKKDITIVVAPERGADLNAREVARRIMRLAEKNSPAFQRVNAKRAERMGAIQTLKAEVAGLEVELVRAQRELEAEHILAEERLAQPKAPAAAVIDPASPEGYAAIMADDSLKLKHQDALDALFHDRIFSTRNALRELGWEGEGYGALSKSGVVLEMSTEQISAGKNVVAVSYTVGGAVIADDLSQSPAELAAVIDAAREDAASAAIPAKAAPTSKLRFTTLHDFSAHVESLGAEAFKAGQAHVFNRDVFNSIYESLESPVMYLGNDGFADFQAKKAGESWLRGWAAARAASTALPKLANTTSDFATWIAASAVAAGMAEAIEAAATSQGGSVAWGADLSATMDSIGAKEVAPERVLRDDPAAVLAGMATVRAVAAGATLDDATHAIATLQNALWTVVNNEPINRAEGNIAQADLEAEAAASFRDALAKLGAAPELDSADDEDFDEDAEWEATPEEDDEAVALDGDFTGHPFRGNQHRKGSRTSGTAVAASIHAKKVSRAGGAREVRTVHRIAHHSHLAASLAVTTRAARHYHRKMARLHAKHAGVEFSLDSAIDGLERAVTPREAKALIREWEKATGDRWDGGNFYEQSAKELHAMLVDIELTGKHGRGESARAEAAATKRMKGMGLTLDGVHNTHATAVIRNADGAEAGMVLLYQDGSAGVRDVAGNRVTPVTESVAEAEAGVVALLQGRKVAGRKEFVDAMTFLAPFLSKQQFSAMKHGAVGEESQFFTDKAVELADTIRTMPETYGQDGKGDVAVAYLHYFKGGADWYITEKDKDGGVLQAFGLADLFGDGGELGYISIEELTRNGAELDFHWTPKTLSQIRGKAEPDEVTPPVVTPNNEGPGLRWRDFSVDVLRAAATQDGDEIAMVSGEGSAAETTMTHNGALLRTRADMTGYIDFLSGDDIIGQMKVDREKSIEENVEVLRATMAIAAAKLPQAAPEKPTETQAAGVDDGADHELIAATAAAVAAASSRSDSNQLGADKALFQSVIDGTVADILSPALADDMEAAFLRHESNPEIAGLFEQAVNAYQAAMLTATAAL